MDTGKKILLVEDDISFATLNSKLLQKAGYSVIIAHDGIEAAEIANEKRPDIMIIDIGIPKKDGLELCREIRQTEWGKKMGLVILTGKEMTDEILQAIVQVEPAYYCIKGNVSTDDFISKIREIA